MTTSARAACTRHQLLEVARDAFSERGYRATTAEWLACVEFVVRDEPDEGERYERMVHTVTGIWLLGTAPPL
jgi:hypothetical protein